MHCYLIRDRHSFKERFTCRIHALTDAWSGPAPLLHTQAVLMNFEIYSTLRPSFFDQFWQRYRPMYLWSDWHTNLWTVHICFFKPMAAVVVAVPFAIVTTVQLCTIEVDMHIKLGCVINSNVSIPIQNALNPEIRFDVLVQFTI